jgi:hypothetical protein
MSRPTHPQVTGKWTPSDGTTHTLQHAPAEGDMYALRSATDPEQTIFATKNQINSLAKAVNGGSFTSR